MCVLITIYFLPFLIALARHHHNAGSIFVLNLFLGWTFIGWVIPFAMALSQVHPHYLINQSATEAIYLSSSEERNDRIINQLVSYRNRFLDWFDRTSFAERIILFSAAGLLGCVVGWSTLSTTTRPLQERNPAANAAVGSDSPSGDEWTVTRERSQMDDSETVSLSLAAEAPIQGWLETFTPNLVIRCMERKTSLFVETGMSAQPEYGTLDGHTIELRIDDGRKIVQQWTESTDNKALFAPAAVKLARELGTANTVVLRFTPFNSSPQVATFSLRGISSHLGEVANTCGWKS